MEKESEFYDMEKGSPSERETGKKAYAKAELTVHGDLNEVTGGEDPVS